MTDPQQGNVIAQVVGERVRQLRDARGWKQQTLAEMIGAKSHSTIAEIETGTRFPTARKLRALARVFDVTVDSLMGEPDDAPQRQADTMILKASLRSELAHLRSCHEETTRRLERVSALIDRAS